jgi:hypothetical protein
VLTDEQERALIAAATAGLDDELRDLLGEIMADIRAGMAPRDAVAAAMATFQGAMAETMATALSAMLQQSVGAAAVMALQVGTVSLSGKLYAEGQRVSADVEGIVRRHAAGLTDARRLALQLFEGYAFRPPGAEPLQWNANNPALPRYLREALLDDEGIVSTLKRQFARLEVDGLTTAALRAAYSQVLEAIDQVEAGAGAELLQKRLKVAWYERMRYFSSRIARTELHRAYAEREAQIMADDPDIEYVQVRRVPGRTTPCICSLMAGRDRYGLGPGVYPKREAPVPPFHPFCQCRTVPRTDLTGRRLPREADESADRYFLQRVGQPLAGRIMGSQAKAEAVLRGVAPEAVINSTRDPAYRIKTAAQVTVP